MPDSVNSVDLQPDMMMPPPPPGLSMEQIYAEMDEGIDEIFIEEHGTTLSNPDIAIAVPSYGDHVDDQSLREELLDSGVLGPESGDLTPLDKSEE